MEPGSDSPSPSLDRRRFLVRAGRRGWPLLAGLLASNLPVEPSESDFSTLPPPGPPPGVDEAPPRDAVEDLARHHQRFLADNPDLDPFDPGPV